MPKWLPTRFIVVLWGLAAASEGFALGFGTAPESVTYGRPLDLAIALKLRPDETLDSPCLSVEVDVGERRLPRRAVQVFADPPGAASTARMVRIRSTQVVDEPIVSVSVSAGCADKVVRRFTVFADPAEWAAPATPVLASSASVPAAEPVATQAARPPRGTMQADANPSFDGRPGPRRNLRPRGERSPTPQRAAAQPASASPQPTLANAPVVLGAKAKAARAESPRLRLDHDDRLDAAAAAIAASRVQLEDALAAASAMQAAASTAAATAAQRMASIERDMQQLRAAASASQGSAAQIRARLVEAESRNQWLPVLAALLAVLGGLAIWLSLRLRALGSERQHATWAGLVAAMPDDQRQPPNRADEAAPAPAAIPAADPRELAVSSAQAAAALLELHKPDSAAHGGPVHGRSAGLTLVTESAATQLSRPVSVEELIDLEQQAEFFAVLGQDESAIDLLMTHLRATGGISPLPYLKLLEIYRRGDNRAAYDRMRKRFNHRFNANAPDWDSDPSQGRSLLEYDDVMTCLQASWNTPVDAMAELETLLFRRTHGGLFELPAYRDLLMLYAIARDLRRAGDATALDVDVMLPLSADEKTHRAMALHLLVSNAEGGDMSNEDRPTAPVDLDLSVSPRVRDSVFSVLSPVTATLRRSH